MKSRTKPRIRVAVKGGTGEKEALMEWGDLKFLDMADEWFQELDELGNEGLVGDEQIIIHVYLMTDEKFQRLMNEKTETAEQ